jgi:small subunit ribosomal protein S2
MSDMQENNSTSAAKENIAMYPGEGSREMIDAGVFYGRKKSKTNPKMRQFIFANRGGIDIVDLQKTAEAIERATGFIKESIRNGKELGLIVGTEAAAGSSVLALAKEFNLPYVTTRWVGGTITNFSVISKRIDYLKKNRADLVSGALDHYTKKERLEIDREVHHLEELMGGLELLPREPDFLVVVNPVLHETAVREARRKRIPIIAFANVDADPDVIDYLVPGNDKAKSSIVWFLGKIAAAIKEGKAARVAQTVASELPTK